MNQDMSILTLVLEASAVVQVVMLLLLLVSVATWSVIFSKVSSLKRVRQDNDEFDREFWAGRTLQELYQDAASGKGGPSAPQERIFAGWHARVHEAARTPRGRGGHLARRGAPRDARQLPA